MNKSVKQSPNKQTMKSARFDQEAKKSDRQSVRKS